MAAAFESQAVAYIQNPVKLAVMIHSGKSRYLIALLFVVFVVSISVYLLFSPVYEDVELSVQAASAGQEEDRTARVLEVRVRNAGPSSIWYLGSGKQIAEVQILKESEGSLTWVESSTFSPVTWIELPADSEAFLIKPLNDLEGNYIVRFEISDWRGRRKYIDAKLSVSLDGYMIER